MISNFMMKYLWRHLGFDALDPEEFSKRTTLVQLGAFTAVAGTFYCLFYLWLGFGRVVYAVWIYIGIYFVNFLIFYITKNYSLYRFIQPFLILLAVVMNHMAIGGYTDSSIVVAAGFLAPVLALAYDSRKTALFYHLLFLVAIAGIGVWDYYYAPSIPQLPKNVYTFFFSYNIITTFSIIYLLMNNFLKKQDELQDELKRTIDNLKATQEHLVQAEKMASLGELIAGIAHEIQNPLNFVNNFSEVSSELVVELEDQQRTPIRDPELESELLDDLKQNLFKISHHGHRASSIVKGMLEHSRASDGQRRLTDLNTLADEYMRLAYQGALRSGVRASDKNGSTGRFTCELITDFDVTIEPVYVMPQDIGRVLLNLFNNAFYAVSEKHKIQGNTYHPAVSVITKRLHNTVEIRVKDNGTGMPAAVKAKIFQPFFTTKPVGQGTGLGLSLSYDIVTKGHGGVLSVESTTEEGTVFCILLPITREA